jgi:hypothetical protein
MPGETRLRVDSMPIPQANSLPSGPRSVRAIHKALAGNGPMTSAQLHGATGLPRRTIYNALCRLRDSGVLGQRGSLRDTRQTYFWLVPPAAVLGG